MGGIKKDIHPSDQTEMDALPTRGKLIMNYQPTSDHYSEGFQDAIAGLSHPMFRKVTPQYTDGYNAGKAQRDERASVALTDANFVAEGYCR